MVEEANLREYGCPSGALGWFYLLMPALSFASPQNFVVAWDKPIKKKNTTPKKLYGVFQNHAVFWDALQANAATDRFGYEKIQIVKHIGTLNIVLKIVSVLETMPLLLWDFG